MLMSTNYHAVLTTKLPPRLQESMVWADMGSEIIDDVIMVWP